MLKFIPLLLPLVSVLSLSSFAQITLSGKIGNMTIDSSGNPYIIADNITVPPEKTLTITEGVVLLFKPFTGFIIEGSLIINGGMENPVILTTINDTNFNSETQQLPNPFDWNGIFITKKAAQVTISNVILEYSVYGVKSQKEEFTISNGTFKHNGQFHVTINDAIKNVVDGIPFNYSKGINKGSVSDHSKKSVWRKPAGIGLGAAGLAAAGVGGYFFYLTDGYTSHYNAAATQDQADKYSAKSDAALTTAVGCTIGGVVSLVSGIIIFPKKTVKAHHFTISPILGIQNGLTIAINY